VHLQRLDLAADLEMHFGPFGYAGLARLHGGAVNLCGLFRRDASCEGLEGKLRNIRADPRAFLARVVSAEAAARLNSAEVDNESFASVSGFEFTAGAAKDCGECRIGDSISMIPPVTGNGMSLAVESAFVAAPVLSCYAAGKLDWAETRRQVSQLCEREFRSRLLFSSFLQKLLFLRAGRFLLLSSIRTVPGVMRLFFAATR
jgi:2-polyprenyl-6-methoxyphenol hydroxylase-like FAD-dependent oxidoreductase